MGSGGAIRLIEAAQSGAPSAAAIFPREAAANRGLFYVNGAPRSAGSLLQRLNLDATAGMGSPSAQTPQRVDHDGDNAPMSPALAQALFAMALLPLLRSGEDETQRDPVREALNTYARNRDI
jgi:hypothetical protein